MDNLENEPWTADRNSHSDSDLSDDSTHIEETPKLPLASNINVATPHETGFHRSIRVCLEHIRDAMLHHRWQEAAEYMACYPQVLEDTVMSSTQRHRQTLWRISTEILHHLPNSTLADYNIVYERMKHSGVRHYLMITLEHSFHLMLQGHIEDAKGQLVAAESWRYGMESVAHHQKAKLIHAYKSLLSYVSWSDKTSKHSEFRKSDENQTDRNSFRQASVNFKMILKNPGIWDPFILSYVEMLEFYEAQNEALAILNDYAYDSNFPPNPNAHVYLYQYLKRHDAPEKKLTEVLKVLHTLVPSHELMLEYISLLLRSESDSAAHKALGVVLEMLDFACWRRNLDVWENLKTVIQQLQTQLNWEGVVVENMAQRKDWWPSLHFTSSHASHDRNENPDLFKIKSSLTEVLFPDCTLNYNTEQ